MPQLKPRARPEPEVDWCEALMFADDPPEPLIPDAEALGYLADPDHFAGRSLPPGLWRWVHAQPGGAEIWDEWIRVNWRLTDEKLAAKRGEKVNV